jgi:GTP cyclohydrolase I
MTTRGVHKHGTQMITSYMTGAFRDDPQLRREFQMMLGMPV